MISMKPFLLIFFLSSSIVAFNQQNIINHTNESISYQGRFNHLKTESRCIYSASSITIKFKGNDISAILTEYGTGGKEHTNYVLPILDGDTLHPIALKPGKKTYLIVNQLDNEIHHLVLYKQTETYVGEIGFLGFRSKAGIELLSFHPPERKIMAIGDSWTAAYGNAVSYDPPPKGQPNVGFHSINQNHYESWSSILSRKLNSQLHCIAISGRGMYRNSWNSTENTIPKVFDYYHPDKKEQKIKHKLYQPDLILIHLGTNDFIAEWLGDQASPLNEPEFISAYEIFLKKLTTYYPNAKIICIAGNSNSDWYPEGLKQLTRFRTSLKKAISNTDNQNISFFELSPQSPPYGEEWHPTIKTHYQIANEIEPYIKNLMGWL